MRRRLQKIHNQANIVSCLHVFLNGLVDYIGLYLAIVDHPLDSSMEMIVDKSTDSCFRLPC